LRYLSSQKEVSGAFLSLSLLLSQQKFETTDQCGNLVTAQDFIKQTADGIPPRHEGRPDPKMWPWPFFASLFIHLSPLPGAWLALFYGMYPPSIRKGPYFSHQRFPLWSLDFLLWYIFAGFLTTILHSSFSYSGYLTEIKYIFKN